MEINEDDQEFVLKAELPGVSEKDVSVSLEGGDHPLRVQGHREAGARVRALLAV